MLYFFRISRQLGEVERTLGHGAAVIIGARGRAVGGPGAIVRLLVVMAVRVVVVVVLESRGG